ncbi:MAG: hypothetical protein ACPGGB_00750 [Flavobacteriales bacterium]
MLWVGGLLAEHGDVALRFGEVQYGDDMVELRDRLHTWTSKACLEMRANWDAQV